jgi:hypothetical protein
MGFEDDLPQKWSEMLNNSIITEAIKLAIKSNDNSINQKELDYFKLKSNKIQ